MTQARAALDWRSTRRQHPPLLSLAAADTRGTAPAAHPAGTGVLHADGRAGSASTGPSVTPVPVAARQTGGGTRPAAPMPTSWPPPVPPHPALAFSPGRPSPGLQRQPRQLLPTHPRLPEDTGEARWWGKVYPSCPGTGGCIPAEDPNSETLPARPSPARPLPLPCSSRPRPPDQAGGSSSGSWDSPPPPPPSRALRFFDISAQGWGVGGLLHTPALPPQREE